MASARDVNPGAKVREVLPPQRYGVTVTLTFPIVETLRGMAKTILNPFTTDPFAEVAASVPVTGSEAASSDGLGFPLNAIA